MGEEAVNKLQVKELEFEAEKNKNKKEDGSTSVIRWERFLPRMVLRVLLVEADDSTRQIIAALLRKCSFRVAAVADGLKAWEVLKGKPHNIDLILTEVDLPSISGFALLTLIMEHGICKNIPVIMMSSHDSVSMVYKCMLRGAADFLVKPVRKNELQNLWQHVWRRRASTREGHDPQDECVAQQKVEATAENNASSNHSSGYMACLQRNRECIEKGCDAQSSCTKPELEAERAYAENVQDLSQTKWSKSPRSDMKIQKYEERVESSRNLLMYDSQDRGLAVAAGKDANAMTQGEDVAAQSQRDHANIFSEACDNNHVPVNSSKEVIDLIGTFDNYTKCSYRSSGSNNGTNKVDSPLLDLSLRRPHPHPLRQPYPHPHPHPHPHPSGFVNQVSDERHTLNHSDASAFSRYTNRALRPLHSSTSICDQQENYGTNSDGQLSNHTFDYNSDTHGFAALISSQKNMLSLATGQCGQPEVAFLCPQQTVLPVPVPVRGVRFDSLCTAFGSVVPPTFCTESGPSMVPSPGSVHHQEPSIQVNTFHQSNLETRNSLQFNNLIGQTVNNSTNQTEHKQRHKLESSEDLPHFSSATDQSASSSFCNGTASHLNSIGCVSNGNVDQLAVVQTGVESVNEEGLPINDRNCHRSVLREAALTKFRLKRKDRCYEKKVRYESRKKLAEQRARVKGQFIHRGHTEPAPVETDSRCGNSLDG
ncbi:hypothetical protein ACSBR1_008739 [Camellia fascicularis]